MESVIVSDAIDRDYCRYVNAVLHPLFLRLVTQFVALKLSLASTLVARQFMNHKAARGISRKFPARTPK